MSRIRRLQKVLAGAFVLSAGAAAVVIPGEPARADSAASAPVTQSTWYWQQQASGLAVPGSPPATVPDPTVPSGDLAVGGPELQSKPAAETYLEFDVSSIPSGSTITSFQVTLPVDPSAPNLVPSGTVAPMIACLPQESWTGGPGPQPFTSKPSDQCAPDAPKVTSKDGGKSYTVDITSIASNWVSQSGLNMGVAITDDPSNATTAYQIAFGPPGAISQLRAAVTFVPPAGSTAGFGAVAGSAPPDTSANVPVLSPAASLPLLADQAPSASAAPPATSPATAAAPGPRVAARAPRKASAVLLGAASSTPPIGFWLAGLLLLFLLGACAAELAVAPRQSRRGSARGVGQMLGRFASEGSSGDRPPPRR